MEYRAAMVEKNLSASTVNVRLSAIRKLVGEAQKNGILDAEQAAKMTDVPNVRRQGTRLGNWLTRDQAKELLAVPDRSTIKGKRDYCILALLVGCALRRRELSTLTLEDIQLREGRWVIVDLVGKGGRVRTVAIPVWGETRHQRPADGGQNRRRSAPASALEKRTHPGRRVGRLGDLECGRGLRERDRYRALRGA